MLHACKTRPLSPSSSLPAGTKNYENVGRACCGTDKSATHSMQVCTSYFHAIVLHGETVRCPCQAHASLGFFADTRSSDASRDGCTCSYIGLRGCGCVAWTPLVVASSRMRCQQTVDECTAHDQLEGLCPKALSAPVSFAYLWVGLQQSPLYPGRLGSDIRYCGTKAAEAQDFIEDE